MSEPLAKRKRSKRLGARLLALLPPRFAGAIEYRLGHHRSFYPWGAAMNGQTARLEICRRCLTELPVQIIVETGTYRGTTTEWLAGFGKPVITIEAYSRSHAFAVRRLARRKNVTVELGDSATLLSGPVGERIRGKDAFVYLDAHGPGFPLVGEIRGVAAACRTFVIVIDDFRVDGDQYGYDDYGKKGACTLPSIAPALTPDMSLFFPSTPASLETGQRRGSLFVARGQDFVSYLSTCDLLRPAAPPVTGGNARIPVTEARSRRLAQRRARRKALKEKGAPAGAP